MSKPLALLSLFLSFVCQAQYSDKQIDDLIVSSSISSLVKMSSQMIDEGYYLQAEKIVDKLLLQSPNSANYNYRKGFILCESYHNYSGAIPFLEKAILQTDKHFDLYHSSETAASIDGFYYLAKSYHRTNQIEKARVNYNAFLASTDKKSVLISHAELGLVQLVNAEKMQENPKRNVRVVNLGESVNSKDPEYSPVVSFDGSALFYTARRKWDQGQSETSIDYERGFFPEDIYVSYKDFDGSWTEPFRFEFCDPDQNEASISVSSDERRIYIYQDVLGNGDIFYSDFSSNRFGQIKHLANKDVNTKHWDTHCSVTPDGRAMYFASERPGGFGGRDIYRIVKMPDGSWSKPFNLGPSVNSAFDEDAPFIASDNKSLFFASNGTKSMGGFDILVSVIDADNNWSEPVNLMYPVNSMDDDVFYTETIDGKRGYLASTRPDTKGGMDIYEIQTDYLTPKREFILKGRIAMSDSSAIPEQLVVTVVCKNCNPSFSQTSYPRLRDGKYAMLLQPCHEYEVKYAHSEKDTAFFTETIYTDCQKKKDEIYLEAIIDPASWNVTHPSDSTSYESLANATNYNLENRPCEPYLKDNFCFTFFEDGEEFEEAMQLEYQWTFGDGTSAVGIEAKHCFAGYGDYLVELNIIDKSVNKLFHNQVSYPFSVKPSIGIHILGPDTVSVGFPYVFSGADSELDDRTITSFKWELDGVAIDSKGADSVSLVLKEGEHELKMLVEAVSHSKNATEYYCVSRKFFAVVRYPAIPVGEKYHKLTEKYAQQLRSTLDKDYTLFLGVSDELIDGASFGDSTLHVQNIGDSLYLYYVGVKKELPEFQSDFRKAHFLGFTASRVVELRGDSLIEKEELINTDKIKFELLSKKPLSEDQVEGYEDIYYPFDVHKLNEKQNQQIKRLSENYRAQNNKFVLITSFTDNKGSSGYNFELSKRRSESVRNQLIKSGFPAERIRVEYFGESVPPSMKKLNDAKQRKSQILVYEK